MAMRELSRPIGKVGCHADVYKVFKSEEPSSPGKKSDLSVEYHCKVCGRVSDNQGMLSSFCVEDPA